MIKIVIKLENTLGWKAGENFDSGIWKNMRLTNR